MMGVIEHWRAYGSSPYRTYAENWARKNAWTLFDDTSGRDQRNPNWHNRMTAGYTYLRLGQAGSAGATVADVVANLDDQLALQVSPEREQLVDYVFPGQTHGLVLVQGRGCEVHGIAHVGRDGEAHRRQPDTTTARGICRTTRST